MKENLIKEILSKHKIYYQLFSNDYYVCNNNDNALEITPYIYKFKTYKGATYKGSMTLDNDNLYLILKEFSLLELQFIKLFIS